MTTDRLREITRRAEADEYHCREHWGMFDADADVLWLVAQIQCPTGDCLVAGRALCRACALKDRDKWRDDFKREFAWAEERLFERDRADKAEAQLRAAEAEIQRLQAQVGVE